MADDYEFKAGQTVAYFGPYARIPVRRVVERVTPSGIAILGGSKFNKDGYERGSAGWSRLHIRPWTDKDDAAVREEREARAKRELQSYRNVFPGITEAEVREAFEAAIRAVFSKPRSP